MRQGLGRHSLATQGSAEGSPLRLLARYSFEVQGDSLPSPEMLNVDMP